MKQRILYGDVFDCLQSLPESSVHVVVTSPPYWSQREYGVENEIGAEDTVEEYVDRIVDVGREISRILRDDGSFMLNIGDTYVNKSLQLIPYRVFEGLRDDVGMVLRRDIVWSKQGRKPDPANDRRGGGHEYVFHFTNQRDYWYDESVADGGHTSIIDAPTATSQKDHLAVYSESFVREVLKGIAPPKVCASCGTPYERTYEKIPRPFTDPERTQSQRALELFEESELTYKHVDAIRSVGISDVGKAVETEDGAGRNAPDVIERAREAKDVLGGYYREFTMMEREPQGWTPDCSCESGEDTGVVCDPFVGSGTTLSVAEEHGLRGIGIDIDEECIQMSRDSVEYGSVQSI